MSSEVKNCTPKNGEIRKIRRYAIICAVLWTLLLSALSVLLILDTRKSVIEAARSHVLESFEKDLLFRRWAARHGGVYVPVTPVTPPNPYLTGIPERDITTPSGKRLTLMNPSYMTRQIFDLAREQPHLTQGHITSLNPLRPENAPDAWEAKALALFAGGEKEVVETVQQNGQPYFRFMRPLLTEKPCLTCHAAQGYKEGDLRGGISVTFSMASLQKAAHSDMQKEALTHLVVWLLGLGFIWVGTRKIVRVLTLLRDERNRLFESEAYLRVIFEASESGIIMVSPTGVIDFANRRMAEMFGMTIHELIGTSYPSHLHESEKQVGDERMRQLIRGDIQSVSFDRRYIRLNGTDFWGHLSGRRVENEDGTLRSLVGVISDVSERKQSEIIMLDLNETLQEQKEELQVNEESLREQNYELQTTEEMLREQLNKYEISQKLLHEEKRKLKLSEEKFATAFRLSPDAICINRLDNGMYLDANEGFTATTGYTPDDVAGRAANELDIWVDPEDRIRLVNALKESGVVNNLEAKFRRKDGSILTGYMSAKVIEIENESCILSITRDMTELKRIEEEKRTIEQQFQHAQKLESLGVLAGGVAHDFNNILTIILGHCYMAREDLLAGDEYKTAFERIEAAGNRAAELCRQMLTYAGKNPLVQAKVNLWLLVDEVVKMLTSAFKKNVTIECDLQRDIPEINGDSGQLQQIIMNLIINAAEAIGNNNGTIRVALLKASIEAEHAVTDAFGTVIKAGHYVCLEVCDNGTGMDEETQKRIFEPFFTTKFTGRGLGMAAIQGIVKAHEGILQLGSSKGVGTLFKVCFPVPEKKGQNEEMALSAVVPVEKSSGSVLLVDDEQGLRDMGTNLLEAMGYTVMVAEHGRAAVELFHQRGGEIDIVLLDMIMPVMGGIEAYHEFRQMDATLPIVICSGYGVESVEDVIKNDQRAYFMNKPYKPNELRDVIGRMKR